MNLFLLLGAAGLSHELFGERLLPVGTLYDPFIARGLDALNYACYQDARFLLVATPSGVTLAPEGGAHQSVGTPLIGMSQDGLAAFEPAFSDELAIILEWALEYMQRDGAAGRYRRVEPRRGRRIGLSAPVHTTAGAAVQRPLAALRDGGGGRRILAAPARVRMPKSSSPTRASWGGLFSRKRSPRRRMWRKGGATSVFSPSRRPTGLNAGWQAAQRARMHGENAEAHIENVAGRSSKALPDRDRDRPGHPATLSWLGAVHGHRVAALGVEHFGQTGTIADLYRHFEIDRGRDRRGLWRPGTRAPPQLAVVGHMTGFYA